VTLALGVSALALTAIALLGWTAGEPAWYWAALALGMVTIATEWALVRRLERLHTAVRA
jgi:hypothetical protein